MHIGSTRSLDILRGLGAPGEGDPGFVGPPRPVTTQTGSTWFSDLVAALPRVAESYAGVKQSGDLYKINKQRLAAGLPPVDTSAIAPRVNVGIAPDTISKIAIPAVIGLALIMFMMRR